MNLLNLAAASILYFVGKRFWYSTYLFGAGSPAAFFRISKKKLLVEYFSSCLLSLSMEFLLSCLGSPSTLNGVTLGAFLWLLIVVPSFGLSSYAGSNVASDLLFQLVGLLFLGAFLGS